MKYQLHCYHCKKWSNRLLRVGKSNKVVCEYCQSQNDIYHVAYFVDLNLIKYCAIFSK